MISSFLSAVPIFTPNSVVGEGLEERMEERFGRNGLRLQDGMLEQDVVRFNTREIPYYACVSSTQVTISNSKTTIIIHLVTPS